jgi:hypothetical protein
MPSSDDRDRTKRYASGRRKPVGALQDCGVRRVRAAASLGDGRYQARELSEACTSPIRPSPHVVRIEDDDSPVIQIPLWGAAADPSASRKHQIASPSAGDTVRHASGGKPEGLSAARMASGFAPGRTRTCDPRLRSSAKGGNQGQHHAAAPDFIDVRSTRIAS